MGGSGQQMTVEEAGLRIIERESYSDEALVRRASRVLRENAPIHYVDHPAYPPLWVLTSHADIRYVEQHAKEWAQGRFPFLFSRSQMRQVADIRGGTFGGRMLIHMDGQEHDDLRALTASWFSTRNLAQLEGRIAMYARDLIRELEAADGACDFAKVACYYPLRVVMSMLGVPEEDHEFMLDLPLGRLDNEDPFSDTAFSEQRAKFVESHEYFMALSEERRAHPKDDLVTVIATAPAPAADWLGPSELVGYNRIFAIAGHDSTTASIVGGLHAMAQFPEALERLSRDPTLIATAADEIIRWVTPLKHFTRTAIARSTIRDIQFEVGDRVYLSYAAANQDPTVFRDPEMFDVGRSPNPHLSFGAGAHLCLGAQLARMEVRAFLTELVPRLRWIELAGDAPLRPSIVIGGFESLPIRYELT